MQRGKIELQKNLSCKKKQQQQLIMMTPANVWLEGKWLDKTCFHISGKKKSFSSLLIQWPFRVKAFQQNLQQVQSFLLCEFWGGHWGSRGSWRTFCRACSSTVCFFHAKHEASTPSTQALTICKRIMANLAAEQFVCVTLHARVQMIVNKRFFAMRTGIWALVYICHKILSWTESWVRRVEAEVLRVTTL